MRQRRWCGGGFRPAGARSCWFLKARAQGLLERIGARLAIAYAPIRLGGEPSLEAGQELAAALEAVGRRGEADVVLGGLIERFPAAVSVRRARARLAERRQRPDLAEAAWRRVLAMEPGNMVAEIGTVRALRQAGRLSEAEAAACGLCRRRPDASKPWQERARLAAEESAHLEAEDLWRQAAALAPEAMEPLLGIAKALAAQHRFADARRLLEDVAERWAASGEPLTHLCRLALQEGDDGAAEAAARRLIERQPEAGEPKLLLARVLERRWHYASASRAIAEVATAWPELVAARLAAAKLALLQGNGTAAYAAFAEVLDRDAEGIEARLGLAEAAALLEEEAVAWRWLDEALALAPLSLQVHRLRVRLAESLGQADAAQLHRLEAQAALPQRQEPRLWLIEAAVQAADMALARRLAGELREAHPRSLTAGLTEVNVAFVGGSEAAVRDALLPLAEAYPEHREVMQRLARLETVMGEVERARKRWWTIARFDPRLHGPVDSLERLDRHPLPSAVGEVRVTLVLRNERMRLPWLFDYYRGLGASRFLVIDNDSDDGTRDWLLAQGPDVHVFLTHGSYGQSASGIRWLHHLLDEHGEGGWVLNVDGDEVLVYPHIERVGLQALTAFLDAEGAEAMAAPMLDMYAAEPIDSLRYAVGESLIEAFPYFDGTGYERRDSHTFPFFELKGGCRARMFYPAATPGPVLQKVPLLRWLRSMRYLSGRHTAMPCRLASVSGALLHFKYTPEFSDYVRREVARGEHYRGASEYRTYLRRLEHGENLSFLHPGSVRYAGSRQLVELGLMHSTVAFDVYADGPPAAR